MTEQHQWHFGNASHEGADHRGWVIGAFMDPGDVRMTKEVELKWGIPRAGKQRSNWQEEEHRTTVIHPHLRPLSHRPLTDNRVLAGQGDYAMWGPGIDHSWQAEEDSVVVTVRWPGTA